MKKCDRERSEQRPQLEVQKEKIESYKRDHIDMLKLDSILEEVIEKLENLSPKN